MQQPANNIPQQPDNERAQQPANDRAQEPAANISKWAQRVRPGTYFARNGQMFQVVTVQGTDVVVVSGCHGRGNKHKQSS